MEIDFYQITEKQFNDSQVPIVFENNITNRCYGLILKSSQVFKFAWQSDIINPVITKIDTNIFSIGIDQNFAVVDFNKNLVVTNIYLSYNFVDTMVFRDNIFVATELEVIRIHRYKFQILESYDLPDFFENIIFCNDKMQIKCTDGSSINVFLQEY